jgi:hypothetical protein
VLRLLRQRLAARIDIVDLRRANPSDYDADCGSDFGDGA